jgi:hypothetical protein
MHANTWFDVFSHEINSVLNTLVSMFTTPLGGSAYGAFLEQYRNGWYFRALQGLALPAP